MVHVPLIGEIRLSKYWNILVALLAILYIASPIDFLPDFIPIIGWIDDVVALFIAGGVIFGGMKSE